VGKVVFLCVPERAQKSARGNDNLVVPGKAERVLGLSELRLDGGFAETQIKLVLPAPAHAAAKAGACDGFDLVGRFCVSTQKELCRAEASELVAHGLLCITAGEDGCAERAGRNIAEGRAIDAVFAVDAGVVVVFRFVEHRALGHSAGGHDADDVALHKTLSERRVFHLLADGDLVALLDKTRDIAFGGVERHAAHGDLVFGRFVFGVVAAGEREVQFAGGDARVLVEHFIEIAQAEKENAVGVPLLDGAVLLHHGRELSHRDTSDLCLELDS